MKARVESHALHPKQAKIDLAQANRHRVPRRAAADRAAEEFDRVHARGESPSDLREHVVNFGADPDAR